MAVQTNINTLKKMVDGINFVGRHLLSVNDLTNEQIYGLFELAKTLEPWNRSGLNVLSGKCHGHTFFPAQHPYPDEL